MKEYRGKQKPNLPKVKGLLQEGTTKKSLKSSYKKTLYVS